MYLKQYLKSSIGNKLEQLSQETKNNNLSLKELTKIKITNAQYVVNLSSCWKDSGETDLTFEHTGSIEDAIKFAENEFMKINKRSDVQAGYTVGIKLGNNMYVIPEEFWINSKRRKPYDTK